jgi:DNA (cytosine-5)-methyltransferase 1
MTKFPRQPVLLDLFCGAGGAAMGYSRAGFRVVGVDHYPQPNYPFEFIQAEALSYVRNHGHEYDMIHASPPCQGYSSAVQSTDVPKTRNLGAREPRLIGATRSILMSLGCPYVIENVVGARAYMRSPILLCGSMFGLSVRRHRLFEIYPRMEQPQPHDCTSLTKEARDEKAVRLHFAETIHYTPAEWMGIDWMKTRIEMREAIPPIYTFVIGVHLMQDWLQTQS